jgi:hypothetical protein
MTIQFLRFGLIVVKFSIRANTEIFERMKNLMPRILISGWQVRYFQLKLLIGKNQVDFFVAHPPPPSSKED